MTLLLIYTATVTPFRIAFVDEDPIGWFIFDLTVDCLFFMDVLVNMFLAYYDDEMNIVVERKRIIVRYLKGWLIPDLFACFPF